MRKESHPCMISFTIAALITGFIVCFISFSLFANGNGVNGILLFIPSLAIIGGAIWLINTSDSFKRWSKLTDGQKAFGWLIMLIGIPLGIVIVIAYAAYKGEFAVRAKTQ